jgi:hypothetical protein
MRRFRWRWVLSFSNVVLAVILWQIGFQEEQSVHDLHPGMFYDGNASHVLPALAVSYSLNAPSLVLSTFFNNLLTRWFGWDERWFHYGMVEYYLTAFVFWWWVGSKLDKKQGLGRRARFMAVAVSLLGAFCAIVLMYYGVTVSRNVYGPLVPISMVLWGLGLLVYFGKELVAIRREV